jgi:hypothetical protein
MDACILAQKRLFELFLIRQVPLHEPNPGQVPEPAWSISDLKLSF